VRRGREEEGGTLERRSRLLGAPSASQVQICETPGEAFHADPSLLFRAIFRASAFSGWRERLLHQSGQDFRRGGQEAFKHVNV